MILSPRDLDPMLHLKIANAQLQEALARSQAEQVQQGGQARLLMTMLMAIVKEAGGTLLVQENTIQQIGRVVTAAMKQEYDAERKVHVLTLTEQYVVGPAMTTPEAPR